MARDLGISLISLIGASCESRLGYGLRLRARYPLTVLGNGATHSPLTQTTRARDVRVRRTAAGRWCVVARPLKMRIDARSVGRRLACLATAFASTSVGLPTLAKVAADTDMAK